MTFRYNRKGMKTDAHSPAGDPMWVNGRSSDLSHPIRAFPA